MNPYASLKVVGSQNTNKQKHKCTVMIKNTREVVILWRWA